jgi:hypothetical protein
MRENQEEQKASEPKPKPKPSEPPEEAKREDAAERATDFRAHQLESAKGLFQAYERGELSQQQLQSFSIDYAKELRQAMDVPDLPATEATIKDIKRLLDIRIDPPPPRLVPRDDHGRKWTIRASEGQSFTQLTVGDIYKIQFHTGLTYKGTFKTILDPT